MRYRYFPGCTLKGQAKSMEDTTMAAAAALGIELVELDEWQCCGAVFPLYEDELITLLSPVRTLAAAGGEPLVSLCAACHHVLKRAQELMQRNPDSRYKVTDFLKVDYSGEGRVLHFLEVLRDDIGFEKVAEMIKKPLQGRKLAAYYGCLLLRPSKVMQFDDPEKPTIMEDLLKALGAEVVITPYRTECCGAYLSVTEEKVAEDTVARILGSARKAGAEALITACPLCRYNLENCASQDGGKPLKVYYFSELLAEALGLTEEEVSSAKLLQGEVSQR
ncbi:MAG TPA: CoB--CoM heterodisulfide reductase iron-sulfur subunit B family protein [Candidatus Limnocylindrales bacterium]|nr:CoB--CoM heterodisulfide reductase iron-sulfur subunit B family protein [Candidatus Limnocylindrales bacterium]